jgi:hypothetical protein
MEQESFQMMQMMQSSEKEPPEIPPMLVLDAYGTQFHY